MTSLNSATTDIAVIRVSLDGSGPEIWRRVVVPHGLVLPELHDVVQIVMGWEQKHLYVFRAGSASYGVPREGAHRRVSDDAAVRFNQLAPEIGDELHYEYNPRDRWGHTIVVEDLVPEDEALRPFALIACKYASPPEDAGGITAFYAELRRPGNIRRQYTPKRIFGRDLRPETVPFNKINLLLGQMALRWSESLKTLSARKADR